MSGIQYISVKCVQSAEFKALYRDPRGRVQTVIKIIYKMFILYTGCPKNKRSQSLITEHFKNHENTTFLYKSMPFPQFLIPGLDILELDS